MAYEVVLDTFTGPLDLLLHLIHKQEVSIHDVSIAVITEQYLDYLRAMEELSLEIASEFVVMASTLLAIKSRMLLPRPASAPAEGEEADPEAMLIEQLIEYQRCKWAAEQLRQRESVQSNVFSRLPSDLSPYRSDGPPVTEGVSLWDLLDAYRKLQRRVPKTVHVAEIQGHVISVDEMMDWVRDRLARVGPCSFSLLIAHASTRSELVSIFLALLELVKAKEVICVQPEVFGEIEVEWIGAVEAC